MDDHIIWAMARHGYAKFYGDTMREGLMEWDYLKSNSIERDLWFGVAKEMAKAIEKKGEYGYYQ